MGLVSYVHVYDERGNPQAFGPDDEVPEWASAQMGAHCFEGGIHPSEKPSKAKHSDVSTDEGDEEDQEPPRGGAGSGRDAWEAFASKHDVDVDEHDTRDQIIEALIEAGVIES